MWDSNKPKHTGELGRGKTCIHVPAHLADMLNKKISQKKYNVCGQTFNIYCSPVELKKKKIYDLLAPGFTKLGAPAMTVSADS